MMQRNDLFFKRGLTDLNSKTSLPCQSQEVSLWSNS